MNNNNVWKFYREPTSLSGDHTANNLRVLRFNTHTQGVTLNRSLWHHDHGWFFPRNSVCTRFSWYQISQLVWSPGEKLKKHFLRIYIHDHLHNLCHWSRSRARGLSFFCTPHALDASFLLRLVLFHSQSRFGTFINALREIWNWGARSNFRTRHFFSSSRLECDGSALLYKWIHWNRDG